MNTIYLKNSFKAKHKLNKIFSINKFNKFEFTYTYSINSNYKKENNMINIKNYSSNNNNNKSTFNSFKFNYKNFLKYLMIAPLCYFFSGVQLNNNNNNTDTYLNTYKNSIKCEVINNSNLPYLGCSIRLKNNEGMQVVLIKSNSPAESAGLKIKDIILEIDGKIIKSINEYRAAIGYEKGAKIVKIKTVNEFTNLEEIKEIRIVFE